MADSFIYGLPRDTVVLPQDLTVMDVYDTSTNTYITKGITVDTISRSISGFMFEAIVDQLPVVEWNHAYFVVTENYNKWTSATNHVTANSAVWDTFLPKLESAKVSISGRYEPVRAVVTSSSGVWNNVSNIVGENYLSWAHTWDIHSYADILNTLSAQFFDVQQTQELTTPVYATDEFMIITIGGKRRAIRLWQFE